MYVGRTPADSQRNCRSLRIYGTGDKQFGRNKLAPEYSVDQRRYAAPPNTSVLSSVCTYVGHIETRLHQNRLAQPRNDSFLVPIWEQESLAAGVFSPRQSVINSRNATYPTHLSSPCKKFVKLFLASRLLSPQTHLPLCSNAPVSQRNMNAQTTTG